MRPLLIREEERLLIAAAITIAEANPMPLAQVQSAKREWSRTNVTPANVILPRGYRCALTYEEQPIGMCKHLSISVDEPGSLPNPHAVSMICEAFGMRFPPKGRIWLEEFVKGHCAVNIVDLIGEEKKDGD